MWRSPPDELSLTPGTVHLWKVDLTAPPQPLADYTALLSAKERQRAERFYFQKDTDQFIVGRGVLRQLIGRYAKLDPPSIVFNYNQFGKPELDPPTGLKFNLSHSGGLAILGFTIQMEIGVDLEQVDRKIDVQQIAKHFFAPNEQTQILHLPAAERALAFFKCWTSKEAFIKAHGQGLSLPLDQFEVEVRPDQAAALKAIHWDMELVNQWDTIGFVPQEGFMGAVVCDGKIEAVSYFSQ